MIVATEGWAAVPLARGSTTRVAELVETIPCSSSATVVMAFDEADCPFDKNWHGILSPMVEKRPLTGVSLMSSKWPDRAPEGTVLLRGFLGGPRDQEVLKHSDEELIELARTQLVELLGVKADAKPRYARLFRWEGGMPQYTLGHLDRVDEIERRSRDIAGFALAGGAYRGVGVPNCLESGEAAVSKVLGDLGMTFEETDAGENERSSVKDHHHRRRGHRSCGRLQGTSGGSRGARRRLRAGREGRPGRRQALDRDRSRTRRAGATSSTAARTPS